MPAHPPPPLLGLLEALELMVAQCRAYERALPSNNYPARAAVATLGELANQALNEAQTLVESYKPVSAAPLSKRECEVLGLVAGGLTNKEIAYRLGISERTIQFHLNSIFNKTGTQSRTEAVALAIRRGWLGGGPGSLPLPIQK
jgi:DNA-binding NarL/FixJ family response regulator